MAPLVLNIFRFHFNIKGNIVVLFLFLATDELDESNSAIIAMVDYSSLTNGSGWVLSTSMSRGYERPTMIRFSRAWGSIGIGFFLWIKWHVSGSMLMWNFLVFSKLGFILPPMLIKVDVIIKIHNLLLDLPSSLHTRAWGPTRPRSSIGEILHGVLYDIQWIMFRGLLGFVSSPPQRGGCNKILKNHQPF